jgi:hypothetical protein
MCSAISFDPDVISDCVVVAAYVAITVLIYLYNWK